MILRALALSSIIVLAGCSQPPPPPPAAIRFAIPIAESRILNSFAVSSDGGRMVYSAESVPDGRRRLVVRSVASIAAADQELANTDGATSPFFSPDGSAVAYFARGAIWHMATSGGTPVRVVDAPSASAGGTWTEDGRIVFAPLDTGLMGVPVQGGTPVPLTQLNATDDELEHGWPHALPGGSIVFTVSQRGRDPHLEVLSPEGDRTRLRVPIIGQAQFVGTGHLVYSFLGNLMAVRFNLDEHETDGVPAAIAKGIQTVTGFGVLGRSGFAVSRTGTLVWLRAGNEEGKSQLVRVERGGGVSPLGAPVDVLQTPRLSPDGRRLAVVARSGVMTREIRILDAGRPDRVISTIQGGDNQSPAWMDSRRLSFGSNRDGLQKIYVASVDSKRPPAPLFTADPPSPLRGFGEVSYLARNPSSWAARLLAFYEIAPGRGRNVLVYRVGESIAPVAATAANERSPSVTRDGRWIAYASDASGRDEVYVARLDRAGDPMQVTNTGATEPVWTREGLFYREGERVMLRTLTDGNLGEPQTVVEGHFERDPGSNLASYDVDPQGRFFIMLKSASQPKELRVVKNWGTELP
jgi:eukaryotic-like serine/threonine-protein kinase